MMGYVRRVWAKLSWALSFGASALVACGGGSEPAPATANDARSVAAADSEAESAAGEPAAEAPAAVDPCAGGTCSHCGDAVCLNGFYCDEGAKACAWIPACAKEPTCECLQQALPGCSCEAREGGLFVSCN
jgi:hypothetical protein